MARYTHARNTFQFGEVSPASFGRADLAQYRQMCEMMKNMLPRSTGGATRRMGTLLLPNTFAETDINDWDNIEALEMIPFSTTYDPQLFLILTQDDVKSYSIGQTPYSGATKHIGDCNGISSQYGISNSWHIANPDEGYLGRCQWAQFGDLVVIVNGINPPLVVFGTSAARESYFIWGDGRLKSDGTLETSNYHTFFPFDPVNATAATMTASAASVGTGRTLTASTTQFTAAMIGRYIRVYDSGTIGVGLITAVASGTSATITILQAFPGTGAYVTWAFSQWGGDRGWPRAVSFYKERLVFAGNTGFRDGFWASQIGDLYEFSKVDPTSTVLNSDSFIGRVGQNESANINHLFPKENLFANMETKECYLSPLDSTLTIGALNTEVSSISKYGAAQIQPSGLMESLVYVGWPESPYGSYTGRKILEIMFTSKDKGYGVGNLSRFTPDITRDRGIDADSLTFRPMFQMMVVTKKPDPIIWVVDTTGRLYSITRDKESEVIAWAHHPLAGDYAGGEPVVVGIVNSGETLVLAVLRNTGGNADQICFEKLAEDFITPALDETAIYLDYTLDPEQSSTPIVTAGEITGLNHLNGSIVHAVVGGEYLGTFTVGSNKITVGTAYNGQIGLVGYLYESQLTLSALESNALFGTGLGQIKRTEDARTACEIEKRFQY